MLRSFSKSLFGLISTNHQPFLLFMSSVKIEKRSLHLETIQTIQGEY